MLSIVLRLRWVNFDTVFKLSLSDDVDGGVICSCKKRVECVSFSTSFIFCSKMSALEFYGPLLKELSIYWYFCVLKRPQNDGFSVKDLPAFV
jgi:hypothetical protein